MGYIASDGTVTPQHTIRITSIDKEILDKIKNVIDKELLVKNRHDPVNKKHNIRYKLEFHSYQITKDICRYLQINSGKKSNKILFPDIKHDLQQHFIRGYFDGDGSIFYDKQYPRVSFTSGSLQFLESINTVYNNVGNILKDNRKNKYTTECYNLRFNGFRGINLLYDLYNNATIYMNRKYTKYLQFYTYIDRLEKIKKHLKYYAH